MRYENLRSAIAIGILSFSALGTTVRLAVRAIREPARANPPNHAELDREIAALARHVPLDARVGWLPGDAPAGLHTSDLLPIVQYALAPRIVAPVAIGEWVLAGPGAAPSPIATNGKPFTFVASGDGGLLLYHRDRKSVV